MFSTTSIDEILAQRLLERRAAAFAAGVAGVQIAYDFHEAFAAVDSTVLRATSDLFGQKIDAIGDLSQRLDAATLGVGLVSNLKGRMAEHVLADHLTALGVPVEMAPGPNQAGWDLTIDGIPVNPKLFSDGTQISDHLSRYPDVPVILPGEATNVPEHALRFDSMTGAGLDDLRSMLSLGDEEMVLVDAALSHAALGEHALDAVTFSADPVSAVHANIPWAVVVLSGIREVRLLAKGHTTLKGAGINLTLDAAGTAGGALAGAKIGAITGSPLGPLGAAVGAVLLGVTGAFLGRLGTNQIKESSLRTAKANLERLAAECAAAIQREEQGLHQEAAKQRVSAEAAMEKGTAAAKTRIASILAELQNEAADDRSLSGRDALLLLDAAANAVAEHRASLAARRSEFPVWRRWFWPNVELLGLEQALLQLDLAAFQLLAWRRGIEAGHTLIRTDLYTLLGALGFAEVEVRHSIAKLEAIRLERNQRLRSAMREELETALALRKSLLDQIGQRLKEAVDAARKAVAPLVTQTTDAQAAVAIEARRLGYKVPG